MKICKRFICIVLTALMLTSTVPISVSAAEVEIRLHTLEDAMAYWEEALGYEIPTKTYYLYVPDTWKFEANEYYDSSIGLESCVPAVYWYGDVTACPDEYTPYINSGNPGYPGYALTEEVAPNVYKAEIPADVEYIVWNNGVYSDRAGQQIMEGHEFICQAETVTNEYKYNNPENGFSYENMLCLVTKPNLNSWQYSSYHSDWFYYYGNGEYGTAPTKELAGTFVYSDGEFPDNKLLTAQSEVTTGVGGEKTIDVNYTNTTATVADENIATISQNSETGDWVVTGVSAGETEVTVTRKFDYTDASESVTVKVKVIEPEIQNPQLTLKRGESASFIGEGLGENAVWKSSNQKVATVDSTGTVTAKGKGIAKITVSQGDVRITCTVKVNAPLPKVTITEVTAKNPKVAVVKWTGSVNAEGYEVQMKKVGGRYKTVKTFKNKNRLFAKIRGLKAVTKYKFRVRGYVQGDKKYYGKFSRTQTVVTPPARTKIKNATVKTAHSVTLSWKRAIGAEKYMILKKAKGQKAYSVTMITKSGKTTKAVIKGLKSRKKYFFKVVSCAKVGGREVISKDSNVVRARTPKRTASSMKFYNDFPGIPRFGYIAKTYSYHKQEIEQDGHNFVFYYYDAKKVTNWEIQWYYETLKNYGFKFYEKWKNSDGSEVYSYIKNKTTVVVTSNSNSVVVGAVKAD